jgi:hypothetical protein
MQASGSSKTLLPISESIWCHIPGDIILDFQWFVLMVF